MAITEETRYRMRIASKGRIPPSRKGIIPWNKGLKASEETRRKLSESHKKKRPWMIGRKCTDETKKKLSFSHLGQIAYNRGMKCSEETRRKNSQSRKNSPLVPRGPRHHNFVDGKSVERSGYRHTLSQQFEHRLWRTKVFERDNYTCRICGMRGVFLHPHHHKSWKDYPEFRYSVENGITLCVECHLNLHFSNRRKLIGDKVA